MIPRLRHLALAAVLFAFVAAPAQEPLGSVAMQDATVAGSLEVTGTRAVLVGNSSVTARDHAAVVALQRGGLVRVCQTSALHLSSGAQPAPGTVGTPLMLALDRGAVEIALPATTADVLLTPDLRFTFPAPGLLDLRLRVTSNGDTCVENSGVQAPTLHIADSFGDATYELHAGQHVLFEHGSLREVVDHETSPCGCPTAPPRTMSLAEAALTPNGASPSDPHPFPAAESAGLAPTPEIPQASPGAVHTQVATTLTFESPDPAAPPIQAPAPATPTPVPPKPHGFTHALAHFFHRLFGGD